MSQYPTAEEDLAAGKAVRIPLSKGMFAIIDVTDMAQLSTSKWCASEVKPGQFYAVARITRGDTCLKYYMHRELAGQPGSQVDHRNGNKLDNRRSNLRVVTPTQNSCNSRVRRDNKSGYRGVYWVTAERKWIAKVQLRGQVKASRRFTDKEEAARFYDQEALKHHGEFACINFPDAKAAYSESALPAEALLSALPALREVLPALAGRDSP